MTKTFITLNTVLLHYTVSQKRPTFGLL